MIFAIDVQNKKVVNGYELAGKVLISNEILDELVLIKEFTYTDQNGFDVASRLAASREIWRDTNPIPVQEYFYDSRTVVGTTIKGKSDIFVNRFNFHRFPLMTYFRNGPHEVGHLLGYSHGSNWTQDTWKGRMMCRMNGDKEDKNFSVPYMMEEVVLKLAKRRGLI